MKSLILYQKREENLIPLSTDKKKEWEKIIGWGENNDRIFQENLTHYQVKNPQYTVYWYCI